MLEKVVHPIIIVEISLKARLIEKIEENKEIAGIK